VLPPISIKGGDFFDRKDAEPPPSKPEPAVSG
jgi:hypothetical protein